MATQTERLDMLERQQAAQSAALRLILEGRWTGEMPNAAAQVDALLGGNVKDFKPLPFPKEEG